MSVGAARSATFALLRPKEQKEEKAIALFVWLISHQPAVLFSQNKPATSNQPAVLFSQNKSAPAISHQPNEQAAYAPCMHASIQSVFCTGKCFSSQLCTCCLQKIYSPVPAVLITLSVSHYIGNQ
jgi:hypothetical protein